MKFSHGNWYNYLKFINIQCEHKVFPWLQTLQTLQTFHCTSVRRVSAVDKFPTRWCISMLGFTCSSVFGCNISKQVDWEGWSDTLGTTIAGYHPLWLLFMGGYAKDKVFSTPVPDITNLKARIRDSFTTITEDMLENTWRENDYRLDVLHATKGAHVGSVLMCCKKTYWIIFWKKKKVCIPHTVVFL